jgi:hypothetical protein
LFFTSDLAGDEHHSGVGGQSLDPQNPSRKKEIKIYGLPTVIFFKKYIVCLIYTT